VICKYLKEGVFGEGIWKGIKGGMVRVKSMVKRWSCECLTLVGRECAGDKISVWLKKKGRKIIWK
jgi:hypothetical protein